MLSRLPQHRKLCNDGHLEERRTLIYSCMLVLRFQLRILLSGGDLMMSADLQTFWVVTNGKSDGPEI